MSGKNGATAVVKPPSRDIKDLLASQQDRLRAVLPKHLSPERVSQIVALMVHQNPSLQKCSPLTILSSVIEACELGLEFGALKEAWLIPYGNECQMQPSYQGLLKLARQSGEIAYIHSRLVHQQDVFRVNFTPDLEFVHSPAFGGNRGPVTHIYAVAKLRSGEHIIEVMTADEVEAVRKRSRAGKSGPWVTDWNEMARKTVLKRLTKALPRSTELARAIEADDRQYEHEAGASVTVVSSPPAGLSRSERLAAQLAGPTADEPEPTIEAPAETQPASDGEEWDADRE